VELSKTKSKRQLLEDLRRLENQLAKRKLAAFAKAMLPDYSLQWFHVLVYDYLQLWVDKKIKKLAIFIPPQHGKSTMSSIITPAFIHGTRPKAKVACASYEIGVSSKFNRSTQDIIESERYAEVFPKTYLNKAGVEADNELRNSKYYETVGYKGSYKSVGVGTGLTSDTVEYGIIDDPIKDRKQANSPLYRDTLWDWYDEVWSTRLNNDSCELMLFTRWHEDDLAGRLFDPKNPKYDGEVAKKWTVIVLPALKEDAAPPIKQALKVKDPRVLNEALWEAKHSAENHLKDKRTSPYKFASLKQQRPSPLDGGMMQREWFQIVQESELPFNPEEVPVHFLIDGAFTEKTKNDPSAVMAYYVFKGKIYIKSCITFYKELNEFLKFSRGYFHSQGYDSRSNIRIEYKSSGPGLMSMLAQEEYGNFNVMRINDLHVSYGKFTRGEYAQPSCASEKVKIISGGWNEEFINQIITFPNDLHDDMFDLLCYAVLQEVSNAVGRVIKTKVNIGGRIA
jgi:predicted phage terminase large subunit-like protein